MAQLKVLTRFSKLLDDSDDVIIDFLDSRVVDHSGLEAIDSLAARYREADKEVHLRHLSENCKQLLTNAGKYVEANVIEDPVYSVAADQPVKRAEDDWVI